MRRKASPLLLYSSSIVIRKELQNTSLLVQDWIVEMWKKILLSMCQKYVRKSFASAKFSSFFIWRATQLKLSLTTLYNYIISLSFQKTSISTSINKMTKQIRSKCIEDNFGSAIRSTYHMQSFETPPKIQHTHKRHGHVHIIIITPKLTFFCILLTNEISALHFTCTKS